MTQAQQAKKIFNDPSLFAKKYLNSTFWPLQSEIANSICKPHSRTAVKSCHASGKSYLASRIALWFVARYKEAIVITTAPTALQVERVMWGEIHTALSGSGYPYPKANLTELRLDAKRYAIGFTTSVTNQNEGVRFQGFHAEHILVILDEAPGIPEKIWNAIEGARSGGDVRVLALGNPTIPGGPYGDAFTRQRSMWNTFTISAFDTPNLAGLTLETLLALPDEELDYSVSPYLISRRWVRGMYDQWGTSNPLWQARVLGQFPEQSDQALISLAWLERAKYDAVPLDEIKARIGKHVTVGIDVAGPGEDETVLCLRSGKDVFLLKGWADPEPRGQVVAELLEWWDKIEVVNVDAIGIGYYFGLHLASLGLPVNLINVTVTGGVDTERYKDLKAQAYWGLRLRLQSGDVRGDLGDKAVGQLSGILYEHNARGQILIESKEDARRKRGMKSPDYAEAVMMAYLEMPDMEEDEILETSEEEMVQISAY